MHHLHPGFEALPVPGQGCGFPSGHATGPTATATALAILAWRTRWRWPTILLGSLSAGVVGLSRVYLEVHTPSDVLAAWALSIAWVVGLHVAWSHGRVRLVRLTPFRSAHSPAERDPSA